MNDAIDRFSRRTSEYANARPGYSGAVVDFVSSSLEIPRRAAVLDVGAGTGLASKAFLAAGHVVTAIEPNAEMRKFFSSVRAKRGQLTILNGRAESLPVPSRAFDAVVAAQAFHWFDRARFSDEAKRVLRPGCGVALLWNKRPKKLTAFLEDYYQALTEHCAEYAAQDHRSPAEIYRADIMMLYGEGRWSLREFDAHQSLELKQLLARTQSISFLPLGFDSALPKLYTRLRHIFFSHAQGGRIRFDYSTLVVCGRVTAI